MCPLRVVSLTAISVMIVEGEKTVEFAEQSFMSMLIFSHWNDTSMTQ